MIARELVLRSLPRDVLGRRNRRRFRIFCHGHLSTVRRRRQDGGLSGKKIRWYRRLAPSGRCDGRIRDKYFLDRGNQTLAVRFRNHFSHANFLRFQFHLWRPVQSVH